MSDGNFTAPVSSEAPKRPSHHGLVATAGNLVLAGIGVAGVLSDEAGDLYRRSVERGQEHVRRAQERLEHARAARRRPTKPAGRHPRRSNPSQEELEAVLAQQNVPTAADINALTQQIVELEAKISQLNK